VSEKPNILVVGSINMDLVVRTRCMPAPGQTVPGSGFVTSPGGKGANQAVAVARMGGQCTMIGRVGDDAFGQELLAGMKAEGIDCANILKTDDVATGVAMIVVDSMGENSIVVAGGANLRLTPDDIFPRADLFERADVLVLQLEVPMPTVRAATDLARRHNCKIILDPAPAPRCMPEELYQVDVISPNAIETEALTGTKTSEDRLDKQAASELIERGAMAAVLKLGARGSLVITADGQIARVPACKVNIVDTTAAGDAFTGALAVAVATGVALPQAARLANAAGALACTRLGAQSAMPTADEVRMLMHDQPHPI
jgi:ribokinase